MSASTPTENGPALPLRPALREIDSDRSPKGGPAKVVSIAESEEEIPPLPLVEEASRPKVFTASTSGRRLTGRPTMLPTSSSKASLRSQSSLDELSMSDASYTERKQHNAVHHSTHTHGHAHHPHHRHDRFVAQVTEWLQAERAKHAAKKSKGRGDGGEVVTAEEHSSPRSRASSQGSDGSGLSLERLQKILEDNMSSFGPDQPSPDTPQGTTSRRSSYIPGSRRRASSLLKKLGAGSSDTEYQDNEVIVPSCDVILDNSKTMSYSGGTSEASDPLATPTTSKRAEKERKAWSTFKHEIVKLAHTLRLKGWRGVALEKSDEIGVERLSGALTNAVYVVSPPKGHIPPVTTTNQTKHQHRKPNKLLLRIYGPQVEHLIDRENELGILRRLARKKIGPRLLGTFENGRFEEFFNAQTLRPDDLVDPDTSKQIAKRMRELHDGVDLLEREREEGPFVWLNWDKWVGQCEQVITYLDKEIKSGNPGKGEGWRRRGLICGVEWPLFKNAVDSYRKWLDGNYGKGGVQRELVFAHNDTQYGNILRLIPEEPKEGAAPSPLLLPQNTHRQLIVIDFEYSSANTPGLEFANHFSEWCYNYHDEKRSWACDIEKYPSLEQQQRFIRSYVNHRPQFNARASATPKMTAADASAAAKGSISDFYLDRTPGAGAGSGATTTYSYADEEKLRVEEVEKLVERLLKETRIWRVANSAQWVAWGIVQAKVPALENEKAAAVVGEAGAAAAKQEQEQEQEHHDEAHEEAHDEEAEFDYLAYSQDRAMFFWGDVVGLGLIKMEDLPEELRSRLKLLDY